jgi:hypothetical protein
MFGDNLDSPSNAVALSDPYLGTVRRLSATALGSSYDCSTRGSTTQLGSTTHTGTRVAVRSDGVALDVDYVVVYGLQ